MRENLLAALAMLVLALVSFAVFSTWAAGRNAPCAWSLVAGPEAEGSGEATLALPDLHRR